MGVVVQTADPAVERGAACDDGLLLLRYLEGDEAAFAELVNGHLCSVYGYLARCGVTASDRDDLFQDIFCKVHRGAASYQPERPFKPWLFTVVVNTVRSHFRKLKVRASTHNTPAIDDNAASEPDPEAVAEARLTASWLGDEFERLSMIQREVVLLCCVEQLEYKEAAETLSVPINTVRTHLRRARLRLARNLPERRV